MTNGNGQYHNERLDRIEGIIEATASRQGEIEDGFASLLKAQVLMHDGLSKLSAEVSSVSTEVSKLSAETSKLSTGIGELSAETSKLSAETSKSIRASNTRMDRVEQNLSEATDKINALVTIMDQHMREHREGFH